jgi:imipenem/basic amino acid-specific outer membrane pore
LAHQQINGSTPFDYAGFEGTDGSAVFDAGGGIWLANSSQWSDFNNPGESSYKLQYDLDASAFGVPGLTFMARYVQGRGADGSNANGIYQYYADAGTDKGEEWERDVQVAYVVQDGAAKDLSFKVRQATVRGNSVLNHGGLGADENEVRIITEYPLDIL